MKLENCEVLCSRGSRSLVLSSLQVSGGTIWAFYLTTRYSSLFSFLFFSFLFFSFTLFLYYLLLFLFLLLLSSHYPPINIKTNHVVQSWTSQQEGFVQHCSINRTHARRAEVFSFATCFLLFVFVYIYYLFCLSLCLGRIHDQRKDIHAECKGRDRWTKTALLRGQRDAWCWGSLTLLDRRYYCAPTSVLTPSYFHSLHPSFLLQSFLFTLFLRGTYVAT